MTSRPGVIALTRELLSFDTVNPTSTEALCANHLSALLQEGGYDVQSYAHAEGRTSLVAYRPGLGERPPLCFSGHMDTVPLGSATWLHDPFSGAVEGDRLFGRGASDMKGGLAAMVVAALRLAEQPRGEAGIKLILTAAEETGSEGARHLAGLPDALGEAGALIVGEPTSNVPMTGHKGALWLNARTTGVAAHGSMPEKGVNAVVKAARAVLRLQDCVFGIPSHPVLGAPTLNVGTFSGGININSVPDEAVFGIDIRTVPGRSNRQVLEDLRAYLGSDVKLDPFVDLEAVATDPDLPWVQEVFDLTAPRLEKCPHPAGMTYFTDASILTPALGNLPTLILGPGDPSMAHTLDESCSVSKIEEAVEVYFEIGRRWCEREKQDSGLKG
jgi:succinyl-diaminopimelate desuccinylase